MALQWSSAYAHSMSPGYQKKFQPGIASYWYEITNDYEYPATFAIKVFDKDGKVLEEDWKSDIDTVKLFPKGKKKVRIKFRYAEGEKERKVLVCSVLDKVGYNDQDPGTISRVCSRLWLYR